MRPSTANIIAREAIRTKRRLERLADALDLLEPQAIETANDRQIKQVEAQLDRVYHRAAVDELRGLDRLSIETTERAREARRYAVQGPAVQPFKDPMQPLDIVQQLNDLRAANGDNRRRTDRLEARAMAEIPVTAPRPEADLDLDLGPDAVQPSSRLLTLQEALDLHSLRTHTAHRNNELGGGE